jgi:hypothetical protein
MTENKDCLIQIAYDSIKKNMSNVSKAEFETFMDLAPANVKGITEQIFIMGYVCGMLDEQIKEQSQKNNE